MFDQPDLCPSSAEFDLVHQRLHQEDPSAVGQMDPLLLARIGHRGGLEARSFVSHRHGHSATRIAVNSNQHSSFRIATISVEYGVGEGLT